jgi:SAM-dependent methyltransferase
VSVTPREGGVSLVSPQEWKAVAGDLVSRISIGGFCTELAGMQPLDPRSEELGEQRAAARRGCDIERTVLLADRARGEDPDVRELVALDEAAGIRVHFVDCANELPEDLGVRSARFALWDERVACEGPPGAGGPWRVSRDAVDIERATAAARVLRRAAARSAERTDGTGGLVVNEPFTKWAAFARSLAPALCAPVGPGTPDCSPYHALIQYMRLLGIVGTPQRHGGFYRAALGELAAAGARPRVLIAGAADFSMLGHLLAAYEDAGAAAEVTVIDRCPTPLEVCRSYAKARSLTIRTAVADTAEFDPSERYDVICTDALLVMLPDQVKQRALGRWRALLRPDGRLVTTLRLSPAGPPEDEELRARRVDAFVERVRAEASRRAGLLDLDPDTLATEACPYATCLSVHPIESREKVVGLFERAGLAFDRLDVVDLPGHIPLSETGPAATQPGTFVRIVARRA